MGLISLHIVLSKDADARFCPVGSRDIEYIALSCPVRCIVGASREDVLLI